MYVWDNPSNEVWGRHLFIPERGRPFSPHTLENTMSTTDDSPSTTPTISLALLCSEQEAVAALRACVAKALDSAVVVRWFIRPVTDWDGLNRTAAYDVAVMWKRDKPLPGGRSYTEYGAHSGTVRLVARAPESVDASIYWGHYTTDEAHAYDAYATKRRRIQPSWTR